VILGLGELLVTTVEPPKVALSVSTALLGQASETRQMAEDLLSAKPAQLASREQATCIASTAVEATARRVVYLDTNHWYALGRAMAGYADQPEHIDILRMLADQLGQGELIFPLSAVHYMELAENPRDQQRTEALSFLITTRGRSSALASPASGRRFTPGRSCQSSWSPCPHVGWRRCFSTTT
jgi:hypothetical protein